MFSTAEVPTLPEFLAVSRKQMSISCLPEPEQDLPEVLNPQLFHADYHYGSSSRRDPGNFYSRIEKLNSRELTSLAGTPVNRHRQVAEVDVVKNRICRRGLRRPQNDGG